MARSTFNCRSRLSLFNVVVLILLLCSMAEATGKDLVIMKNGDRLTGQVKKLESGVLYVDLDYVSGSVGVDWLQVDRVESSGGFQVLFKNGERMAGTITKVSEKEAPGKDFEVQSQNATLHTAAPDVVNMESSKRSFWRQLTGSIDAGYGFTSGNGQSQANSDANVSYLTTKWNGNGSFTSSFSGQPGSSKTNLVEVQTLDAIFVGRNSFLAGLGDFLHSSQQDLTLRTTLGGGYGKYLIHTNENVLAWLAGAVYTHETFTSAATQPPAQNAEALLGLEYQLFRFKRYSLQSQLLVYPGLSDIGRIRTTTKTTFSMKLVNNFHTDFSFWDNFDSSPPSGAKRNELGVSNSIGWTF
jgi:putative salt-induced outer membrane protein YdiY